MCFQKQQGCFQVFLKYMHGRLVIHNHFFANTTAISHKQHVRNGSFAGIPSIAERSPWNGSFWQRGSGFTYISDTAAAVSLFPLLKQFLCLQAAASICPDEHGQSLAGRLLLLSDGPCVSSGCLGPFPIANLLCRRRAQVGRRALVNQYPLTQ